MTIQVTTDRHIEGSDRLSGHVKEVITSSLKRFHDRLNGVVVHLTKENSHGPVDLRCAIEVHYSGLQPVAAVNHAATTEDALKGAVDKIKGSLDAIISRLRDR